MTQTSPRSASSTKTVSMKPRLVAIGCRSSSATDAASSTTPRGLPCSPPSPVNTRSTWTMPRSIAAEPATALENRQEAVDLPRRHLDAVLVPLLALDLDEPLERVLSEDPQHEL